MPMMVERSDGGVTILRLLPGRRPDEHVAKWQGAMALREPPVSMVSFLEVDESDIPTDRTFRNAWKVGSGKVDIDLPRAKDLAAQRLNNAALTKMKSTERDFRNDAAAVAVERARLNVVARGANFSTAPNVGVLKTRLDAEMAKI